MGMSNLALQGAGIIHGGGANQGHHVSKNVLSGVGSPRNNDTNGKYID